MSKIAVIYWSQTGNTEMMANAIAEGIREAGAECDVLSVPAVSADQAAEYEKLALGCPAMGAEVLEEMDFEPFFTELERRLSGRPVALFGSYGWGMASGCGTGCSAPRTPTPTSTRTRV